MPAAFADFRCRHAFFADMLSGFLLSAASPSFAELRFFAACELRFAFMPPFSAAPSPPLSLIRYAAEPPAAAPLRAFRCVISLCRMPCFRRHAAAIRLLPCADAEAAPPPAEAHAITHRGCWLTCYAMPLPPLMPPAYARTGARRLLRFTNALRYCGFQIAAATEVFHVFELIFQSTGFRDYFSPPRRHAIFFDAATPLFFATIRRRRCYFSSCGFFDSADAFRSRFASADLQAFAAIIATPARRPPFATRL